MNFSIIGGDLRSVKLAQILSRKNQVYIYGIEQEEILKENNIIKCKSLEEVIEKSEIILGPMPISKDDETINAPFSKENIRIIDVIQNMDKEKIFIAGAIKQYFYKMTEDKNIKVIDLMKQEELTVLNTIATAEGTIKEAIENTEKNIQGSRILVLGFGRVGKVVAKKFKALDAKITCAARKKEDLAWIDTLGYESIDINKMEEKLKTFDIIINTVPEIILTKKELSYINNQATIIDLASKPGGIDQQAIKETKLKYIWALALPGKVSPITSAEYIKDAISNILEELNYLQK